MYPNELHISEWSMHIAFYPQQELTTATGKQTQMETAAISVFQRRTPSECVAVHTEWSWKRISRRVWTIRPMSRRPSSAAPTLSHALTGNVSPRATNVTASMTVMTTAMRPTVALIVMFYIYIPCRYSFADKQVVMSNRQDTVFIN